MTQQTTALAVAAPQTSLFKPTGSVFQSLETMNEAREKAEVLSRSKFIPVAFQGKPDECLIALDFAGTVGVNVLQVMQNLHVVEGLPGWKSPFILGAIRTCGRYTNVRLVMGQDGTVARGWVNPSQGTGYEVRDIPNLTCYVSATDLEGQPVKGTTVSIAMAVAEGWYGRKGSKWPNMPEQMLQYRAGSFFSRVHMQDVLLGMHTAEELVEIDTYAVVQSEDGTGAVEMIAGGVEVAAAPARKTRQRRSAPAPVEVPSVQAAEPAVGETQYEEAQVVADEPRSILDATFDSQTNAPVEAAPAAVAEPVSAPAPEVPAAAPAAVAGYEPDPQVVQALARAMKLGFEVKNEDGTVETDANRDWMESEAAREERIKEQLRAFFAKRKEAAAAQVQKPAPEPKAETQAEKNQRERNATAARQYHGGDEGETASEKVLRLKREELAAKDAAKQNTPAAPAASPDSATGLDDLFPEA